MSERLSDGRANTLLLCDNGLVIATMSNEGTALSAFVIFFYEHFRCMWRMRSCGCAREILINRRERLMHNARRCGGHHAHVAKDIEWPVVDLLVTTRTSHLMQIQRRFQSQDDDHDAWQRQEG